MTTLFTQQCDIPNNQFAHLMPRTAATTQNVPLSAAQLTNAATENNEHYIREIENLRKQVKSLQSKQEVLEVEKEELVNQVSDLKALMKRVAKEGEKNLQHVQHQNCLLQQRVSSLESGLHFSFEFGQHFDQVCDYWQTLE